jgi:hypothetical protein
MGELSFRLSGDAEYAGTATGGDCQSEEAGVAGADDCRAPAISVAGFEAAACFAGGWLSAAQPTQSNKHPSAKQWIGRHMSEGSLR